MLKYATNSLLIPWMDRCGSKLMLAQHNIQQHQHFVERVYLRLEILLDCYFSGLAWVSVGSGVMQEMFSGLRA